MLIHLVKTPAMMITLLKHVELFSVSFIWFVVESCTNKLSLLFSTDEDPFVFSCVVPVSDVERDQERTNDRGGSGGV